MRIRDLVLFAALCGCVTNPDPRSPTPQAMERGGFGGWMVITTRGGQEVSGELISVETSVVRILQPSASELTWVPVTDINRAKLYRYEGDSGFGAWGLLGTLSTISHGFFFILTAPAWILSSSIAAAAESRHVVLEWPEDSWGEIAMWARFPQGMPPELDVQALTRPRARRTTHPMGPVVPPTPEQLRLDARTQAWAWTQQAEAAARAEDCGTVLALSGKVQTIDADFYDTVFATDAAIRRCLNLPPLVPPAP
jgi:hypothetical protein